MNENYKKELKIHAYKYEIMGFTYNNKIKPTYNFVLKLCLRLCSDYY